MEEENENVAEDKVDNKKGKEYIRRPMRDISNDMEMRDEGKQQKGKGKKKGAGVARETKELTVGGGIKGDQRNDDLTNLRPREARQTAAQGLRTEEEKTGSDPSQSIVGLQRRALERI